MSTVPEAPAAPIGPKYKEEEEKPHATYDNYPPPFTNLLT